MKKLLYALAAFFSFEVMADFVVPATPHPVNDYANVLNLHEKDAIAKKMILLKEATGAQMGVLIVDSLNGITIEEASIKVAEAWKLGSKSADSGVLLMLSIKEHKSRLEVGKGLEGFLTDLNSKTILNGMRSDLRAGNYGLAIAGAVDATSAMITKNKADIMTKPAAKSAGLGFSLFMLYFFGGIGLIGGILLLAAYMDHKRRQKIIDYENETRAANTKSYTKYKSSGITGIAPMYVPPVKSHAKSSSSSPKSSGDTTIIAPVIISTHEDYGGYSSSSDSSSSSDNSSSWSGGGGDFSGGGSSDSW